ncbi:MAG: S-adenosylmethionine:tRNA ribosyltransferase-isomerase [Myxococcota bacterium]|jgi:S-adenosylmethionine:tRNA ribosyltransferase-isomerase
MNAPAPHLRAASGPRPASASRLVVLDGTARPWVAPSDALIHALRPGDLLVLNDAATLPASLSARLRGQPVELRIASLQHDTATIAVLGQGDWRMPTERRGAPPRVRIDDIFDIAGLSATVMRFEGGLATVQFDRSGSALVDALHRRGEPVRYSYLDAPVPLGPFQTAMAGPPVASEAPSAALALTWRILLALRRRGVGLATLTHAAGLSSIDGGEIDASLPRPERSWLPEATATRISHTRAAGGRVVAVGTTVVRALEDNIRRFGKLTPGEWTSDLVLEHDTPLRIVHGLLTNLHEPGESHFRLLEAFAPRHRLLAANRVAAAAGLVQHEFGDGLLVLPEGA